MPTRASATRRCICSRPSRAGRSTSTRSGGTSSRSASRSWSPATGGPLKVHVHNERPDEVIALRPRARDPQPDQRREPRQPGPRRPRDAGGRVHATAIARPTATRPSTPATALDAGDEERRPPRRRAGGRRRRCRRRDSRQDLRGVRRRPWSSGGQSANPSTGELLEVARSSTRARCCILPNNPNVVLAARQVAADGGPARRRRPDPERRGGLRGAARARSDQGRRRNAEPMTAGRPGGPDALGDRGRARRDDRRQEGQAGPDDRPRPRRRPASPPATTGRRRCWPASAALEPGYELLTALLRRRRRPGRCRGDGASGSEQLSMGRRSRSSTAGSPTTGT